jgi:hypothetical protein
MNWRWVSEKRNAPPIIGGGFPKKAMLLQSIGHGFPKKEMLLQSIGDGFPKKEMHLQSIAGGFPKKEVTKQIKGVLISEIRITGSGE